MAARSLFLSIKRNCSSSSSIGEGVVFRSLSSGALKSDCLEEPLNSHENDDDDDLKSRIFRLRLPKRSVTNVLQKWVGEGNTVTASELRSISKQLRKSQRYKHALEITEWMITHQDFELSDSDYTVRIDLMTKVFGIDAAERYFEGLPLSAKTSETYTALLHSFAAAKLTEKAEQLYVRMKQADLSLNALSYNEMMTLYMSVGLLEKVPSVVEDLKRQNVAPDLFTYNLWISSCAATLNINEVKRILDEMKLVTSNQGWVTYVNLANIYITTSHLVNSESNLIIGTDKSGITQREWITYDFLIILYAGLGDKEKMDQIWTSLRMTKQKMTSRNYACILSSYLMLGHLKEVGEVVDQWKQSTTIDFDVTVCDRILGAFEEVGLVEKADNFRTLLIQKSCYTTDESN